jgi:two-component system cell cycle sensor histidine kinase PleC
LLRGKARPEDANRWTYKLLAVAFVYGGAWAAFGPLVWVSGDYLNNMLVVTFLCASIAGTAALQAPSLHIAISVLTLYLPIFAALPIAENGSIRALYSLAFMAYTILMMALAHGIHRTVRDALILREQKNGLIRALAKAKEDSDAARLRAEAASRAKTDFLANMSHELRTPLNAIIGFSELIKDEILGPNQNTAYCSYAADIHASGHHLLVLVNDILDLAKIEAGRYVSLDEVVVVDEAIHEAVRLARVRSEKMQISLSCEIEEDLALRVDRRALKQILLNLISNALKFTNPGGAVSVKACRNSEGATIVVADTGCGIAPEILPRIFETFGHGRYDVTDKDKGTGLGLAIVKGLIEAHGGTIGLESGLGRGTTATITLPPSRTLRVNASVAA